MGSRSVSLRLARCHATDPRALEVCTAATVVPGHDHEHNFRPRRLMLSCSGTAVVCERRSSTLRRPAARWCYWRIRCRIRTGRDYFVMELLRVKPWRSGSDAAHSPSDKPWSGRSDRRRARDLPSRGSRASGLETGKRDADTLGREAARFRHRAIRTSRSDVVSRHSDGQHRRSLARSPARWSTCRRSSSKAKRPTRAPISSASARSCMRW
jgi:hypothetical protein